MGLYSNLKYILGKLAVHQKCVRSLGSKLSEIKWRTKLIKSTSKLLYICAAYKRFETAEYIRLWYCLKRGEFRFRISSEGLVAMLWKDNKGILFILNFHNIGDVGFVDRKSNDGSTQQMSCPQLVKAYKFAQGTCR